MSEPVSAARPRALAVGSVALAGGLALVGQAVLGFFTWKDDPFGWGWPFALLGVAGPPAVLGLLAPRLALSERHSWPLADAAETAAGGTCVALPVLGWAGAWWMYCVDGSSDSVFAAWALALSVIGALAPLPVAAWLRRQRSLPDGPAGLRSLRRVALLLAGASIPGAVISVTFIVFRERVHGVPLPLLLGVCAALSLPVLVGLLTDGARPRSQVLLRVGLWLLGTALLAGLLLGGWLTLELVSGLRRFQL